MEFTSQRSFASPNSWQLTAAFFSGVVAYRTCVLVKCVRVEAGDVWGDK